ncbi:3-oxo-tetronate kinase [Roseomonas indoligenes]|uniref:3-oxo-tetronate kinase n=1 Tax=Roseomonas indoligenes TaxID=2820811 RepID=A0A940S839_9PROT|nr:3-oxo-tetronate kinase [Pararoseomonas indoligenes]MBP0493768.1 four-carbon acid sugar kinase family protein [Pararoseomonas indoligenes]
MPLLGCIADSIAGATEVAGALAKAGMDTVQVIGPPEAALPEAEAAVVALEIRTGPAAAAVAGALAACEALQGAASRQILFHHAATFDSTPAGNIGPVADALVRRLGTGFAPVCPAFPAAGRTVYQGHLFVGASLLSESGMERHPLTPMRDASLPRLLGAQTDGAVALVPVTVVEAGAAAIRRALTGLKESGRRYAVLDAFTEAHLLAIAAATAGQALVLGSTGIAPGLAAILRGDAPPRPSVTPWVPPPQGRAAVLAGALTRATFAQIGFARDRMPTLELDPLATPDAAALARQALDWAAEQPPEWPLLIAASAPPDRVAALRARLGPAAGPLVEAALAETAAGLAAAGLGRLMVAGSETAAAVLARLDVRTLRIGAEIDPGVHWSFAEAPGLHLALKPGASGSLDVFLKAFDD